MNDELHKVLHGAVVDRISSLEVEMDELKRPEDGTLALMKQSLETHVDTQVSRTEAKLNWLIAFIFTTVVGLLITIVSSKLTAPAVEATAK